MRREHERNLEILTVIGEGAPVTQRALAERLGVALGLANLYLKRLAGKGFIKLVEFPQKPAARKRLRYILTPRGMAEKSRLSYEYVAYSLRLFRRTRAHLRESMERLRGDGMKRFAICGTGEAAELAYLTLRELGLEPVGVFDRAGGGHFLGFPVRALSEMEPGLLDGVIVATFDHPEQRVTELTVLGVPADRCLTLRRLTRPGPGR